MKTTLLGISLVSGLALSASAQVYINELMVNAPGSDTGREMFELRGSPNMSLNGYYLISLEGQAGSAPSIGDVNQFLNLSSFSLGGNGYLVGRQFGSPYAAIQSGATLAQPPAGQGWTNWSGIYVTDGSGSDMENSATTVLLVNIGGGVAPTVTLDMDPEDDGLLNLPEGWTIVDSVGLMDSVSAADSDRTYGTVNFRAGSLGTNVLGNVISVPVASATSLYVARVGDSTGSTAADWVGATLTGTSPNFVLANASDSRFTGKTLAEMGFGGPNPVPEPSCLALLGIGVAAFALRRKV